MSPYPTVVIVTTAHQNASGIDLKNDCSEPASAKYTALENSITPETGNTYNIVDNTSTKPMLPPIIIS